MSFPEGKVDEKLVKEMSSEILRIFQNKGCSAREIPVTLQYVLSLFSWKCGLSFDAHTKELIKANELLKWIWDQEDDKK